MFYKKEIGIVKNSEPEHFTHRHFPGCVLENQHNIIPSGTPGDITEIQLTVLIKQRQLKYLLKNLPFCSFPDAGIKL